MLKKEFDIMFDDLTPEAQERYCKMFGIDIGDVVDFPIATATGYTDDKGNCQNWSKLAKELGVDHIVSGPYYELWSLDNNGEDDEIIEEGYGSIEELRKYAVENNLYSDNEMEYVIEEVYEVSDDEDEDDTYYLAAKRITL